MVNYPSIKGFLNINIRFEQKLPGLVESVVEALPPPMGVFKEQFLD